MSMLNDTAPMIPVFNYVYSTFEDVVYTVLYQISGVFAVLGNLFVMWVIIGTKTLHTPSNILLFNLALIDHITGIVLIVSSACYSANRLEEFMNIAKGVGACLMMSLFNLFFIGLDRFLTLTFPLKYMNVTDRTKTGALLAAIWVLGAAASYGVYGPKAIAVDCPLYIPDKLIGTVTVESVLGATVILTVLIHTRVYFIAAKQARRIAEQVDSRQQSTTINIKAVKTTLIVLGAFLICYFPSLLYLYSTYDCNPFGGQDTVTVACVVYFISFSGSTVNPVIYTLRRAEFKKKIVRLFNKCGLCKPTDKGMTAEMSMSRSGPATVLVDE